MNGYSRAGIEIAPIVNSNVIAGQYIFISTYPTSGSLNYNINMDVIPAISFNDNISLIPTVSFNYYGIRDVVELVDESTLFEQKMDLLGSGKLIFSLGEKIKIKGGGSYKSEFLRETPAEITAGWGNGLFDYTKLSGGGEIESILNDKGDSIRGGYNYYRLGFSNYEALIDKFDEEFSEFGQGEGRVLDFNAHEIFAEGGLQFSDNLLLSYNFMMTLKNFPDQYIIDSIGEYSTTESRDDTSMIHNATIMCLMPIGTNKAVLNLGINLADVQSDQNHYDLSKYQFVENYYNYTGLKVSPAASIYLGDPEKPIIININGAYGTRNYSGENNTGRYVQDADGDYDTAQFITNTTILVGGSVSIPIMKEIALKVRANYFSKTSNMLYETYYKYNYSTINYFAGITVEFD